jgi:hypothetical protein
MGTPPLPDPKPATVGEPSIFQDVPKTGPILWILLLGFLIPPCALVFLGNLLGGIPHQTLWVILLGIPFPVVLFSLPRKYTIDKKHLTISGFVYRKRIPIDEIESVQPITTLRAMLHPGSVFCSEPGRALKLVRRKGRILVISPTDPAPFLALTEGRDSSKGGES